MRNKEKEKWEGSLCDKGPKRTGTEWTHLKEKTVSKVELSLKSKKFVGCFWEQRKAGG